MRISKLAAVVLLTPLFVACSKGPSESEVQALIEAQYEKANQAMDQAMASASTSGEDAAMVKAVGDMMAGMMPKLEAVEDVNCDSVEGDNTFMCTATIKQSIGGESQSDNASFKVYKVNDEWVLDR